MECIPAIDVRDGRSVRLLQGDYAKETVYGDPVDQARTYAEGGASRLHVVDLDGARSGNGENDAVIAAIAAAVSIPIEVGGGVRSIERASTLLVYGVDRVVMGTAAVEEPDLLAEIAARFPGRVAVGLDHRSVTADGVTRRELAVRGWEVGSGLDLAEVLAKMAALELAGVIVTDIGRDGTLAGPDLAGLASVLEATKHRVIASGGVGTVADLRALKELGSPARRVDAVIVGKALLSGAISLEEAITACKA
jgi:phosphoribosylformimino-5-aminoimidazole carboxamide ribotide isomerase